MITYLRLCACLFKISDILMSCAKNDDASFNLSKYQNFDIICRVFVCFVALRPKSTAMVIAGRSVHLTTLFPGQATSTS